MKCLTHHEIEQVIESNEIPVDASLEEHLESCESCQRRLQNSAGSDQDWNLARETLSHVRLELSFRGGRNSQTSNEFESTFYYTVDVEESDNQELENRDNYNAKSRSFATKSNSFSSDAPRNTASLGEIDDLLESPRHPENLGRVERYEIERMIGRGGMGVVFKGHDSELNRPVAIKILSPHLAGHGTARQRFTREAKAAAAVVHDNVVPIYDIQAESDRPFIVMPFVNGVSLQEYIESHGQVGMRELLRVALQIASGLSAAHAQGLVHRDIKPANILLENGLNRVQITDFGLARAADDAAMTHSGMIAGTPHYMSPEQSRGESIDQRSDLFSLGCVLYFMATGRTLYRGEGPYSVIAQISSGNYTPVRELNNEVPAFIAEIIEKLLEVKPAHRFQSAKQLVHYLEGSLSYLQQPTLQKAPTRLWTSKRDRFWRRLWKSTAACLLLGSGVLLGYQAFFANIDDEIPQSNPNPMFDVEGLSPMMSFNEIDFQIQTINAGLTQLEQQLSGQTFEINYDFPQTENTLPAFGGELDQLQHEIETAKSELFPESPSIKDQK